MPTEKDLEIAKEIKGELKKKLGDKLISVILFGSRARGTAKNDSDMDLFLLMKEKPNYFSRDFDKIIKITDKYLDSDHLYVSPITYGQTEYKKNRHRLFIREVKKGVKIWLTN